MDVDISAWLYDIKNIREFYGVVGERVPKALYEELDALEKRLQESK